jgi:uncharacterized membrane protein
MRRPSIDWLRGLAVLFMIAWHSMDAWTATTDLTSVGFSLVLFTAGWAAPLFLFLAGVSVPFAGATRLAAGVSNSEASWALQKRGWQIFGLAHLFRFQSFLLNPNATWSAILKPDILNVLGMALVVVAWCWGQMRSVRDGLLWLLLPTALIVGVLTPLSREWWWPTLLHPRLEAYIRPVGNFGVFSLFPASAFVFAGAFVGSVMARRPAADRQFHRVLVVTGAAITAAGWLSSHVPSPLETTWLDSVSLFLLRGGVMTAALGVAALAIGTDAGAVVRPLAVLGQSSLLVYWVHVELVYGVFSYPIRRTLSLQAAATACLGLTLAMMALAHWMRRRHVSASVAAASAR